MKFFLYVAILLVCIVPAMPACAYDIPEVLDYDLKWLGVKGGTATLKIERIEGGRLRISTMAQSVDWITKIYPVRDHNESIISAETLQPLYYHLNTSEGKWRQNRELTFKHDEGKLDYIDHVKKETLSFPVPAKVFDPISGFYYVRKLNFLDANSVTIPMFDSKKLWSVEVKVLRHERVKVPAGEFDTVVIKPLLQSEGIFWSKGNIYIWITDDEKKVPVKVKAEVKIGSIQAVLTGGKY